MPLLPPIPALKASMDWSTLIQFATNLETPELPTLSGPLNMPVEKRRETTFIFSAHLISEEKVQTAPLRFVWDDPSPTWEARQDVLLPVLGAGEIKEGGGLATTY